MMKISTYGVSSLAKPEKKLATTICRKRSETLKNDIPIAQQFANRCKEAILNNTTVQNNFL